MATDAADRARALWFERIEAERAFRDARALWFARDVVVEAAVVFFGARGVERIEAERALRDAVRELLRLDEGKEAGEA